MTLEPRDITEQQLDDTPEILSEDECLALLASRDLGRIAFDVDGRIEIFPVNYGMEGRIIVFRTNAGTKLASTRARTVSFEVDEWESTGTAWSVIVRGRAAEVTTDTGRVAEHLRWAPVHPAAPGARFHWVALKPEEISGRRFRPAATGRSRT